MPTEKSDKSTLIAKQVMDRITKNGLMPNPETFAVLYVHYNGQHPEISNVIQKMDLLKQPITNAECERLFDTYLSEKGEKAYIEEASKRVQEMASEVSAMLRDAGTAHKEYNKTLIKQSDTLSSSNDLSEMKKMVASLVKDTRKMIDDNQKLEDRLHQSSAELQQMRQDMQSLRVEAMTDTLTGIPNRKAFDAELRSRAAEATDKNRSLSLLMIDIDYFKIFNDTFGHQVGDQVLRLVAKTIADTLRSNDILARYGGEEFSIISSSTKLRDAEKLAERIREKIATKDIINQSKNEKLGRLSVSLGVAQFEPGEPLAQLIERADRALYKAKAAGRNAVICIEYDKKLHAGHGDIVIDVNR